MVARYIKSLTLGAAVAGILGMTATHSVQAVEIYALDAGGNAIGGPVSTSWSAFGTSPAGGTSVTDKTGGAGTDWEILVGLGQFGSAENGSQPSAIYGASTSLYADGISVFGYRAVFDFDGYTWDSYNNTVPTNPGASDGYWDLFGFNINNSVGDYTTLVNGGSGGAADPVLSTDPAGTPVIDTTTLAGITWGWGGLDYAAGYFEEEHGTFVLDLIDGSGDYIFSAFLDTATDADSDSNYPSWGGFNADFVNPPDGGNSQDVPEPGALLLLAAGLLGVGVCRRRRKVM